MPIRFSGSARPRKLKSPDPINMPSVRENIITRQKAEVDYYKANGEMPTNYPAFVYGITSANTLIKANTVEDLWAGNYLEDLGASTFTGVWTNSNQYFAWGGKVYGFGGNQRLWEADSMEDLWTGTNLVDKGLISNRNAAVAMFSDQTLIYVISMGEQLHVHSSLEDFLAVANYTNYGTSSAGWDRDKKFIPGPYGNYAIQSASILQKYENIVNQWASSAGNIGQYGTSPAGWDKYKKIIQVPK